MPGITGDQALMLESARRLFAPGDGFARVRRQASMWPGVDTTVWDEFVANGWLPLLVPESRGGMGGSASDFVVLMEGLGALLPPEPVGSALAVIPLLAECTTKPAEELLNAVLAGQRIVLAATEPPAPLLGSATHLVPDAHWADVLVFGAMDGKDVVLRAVEVDQANLSNSRTIDGGSLASAALTPSTGFVLGEGEHLRAALARCRNLQRLGAAASLVGIALAAFAKTIDYLKLRRQFGIPIGTFQALQHRAASLHVMSQSARALVQEAGRTVGSATEDLACAAAKAKAAETAIEIVKESVQMHGAIGFSDETDIALLFRRAVALAASHGSPDVCRADAFATLLTPRAGACLFPR